MVSCPSYIQYHIDSISIFSILVFTILVLYHFPMAAIVVSLVVLFYSIHSHPNSLQHIHISSDISIPVNGPARHQIEVFHTGWAKGPHSPANHSGAPPPRIFVMTYTCTLYVHVMCTCSSKSGIPSVQVISPLLPAHTPQGTCRLREREP